MIAWQRVMEYLSSRSDGSLKPFLLRGTKQFLCQSSMCCFDYPEKVCVQVGTDREYQRRLQLSSNVVTMRGGLLHQATPLFPVKAHA